MPSVFYSATAVDGSWLAVGKDVVVVAKLWMNQWKKCVVCVVILATSLLGSSSASALDMSDVLVSHWVGTGNQTALMVVDWQMSTTKTIVFGYRWDGTATGFDLLNAVQAADIGFEFVWHPDYVGSLVFGMGYDVNGNGGSFVSGQPGFTTEIGYATDANDYYREGWYSGYWAYYISRDGEDWGYANEGLARTLADGDWEGWSFNSAPLWAEGPPANIPLVPEPTVGLSMLMAGMALVFRRNHNCNAA